MAHKNKKSTKTNSTSKRGVRRKATVRPNKWTAIIGVSSLALAAALFVAVLMPSNKNLSVVEQENLETAANLERIQAQLSEYASGQVLAGDQLADKVGPAEMWLPYVPPESSATAQALALRNSASAAGLTVTSSDTEGGYGAGSNSTKAVIIMEVAGTQEALATWMAQLYSTPPLKTVKASGMALSENSTTAVVEVTVWGSPSPEWSNGKPSAAGD